jgi:hypothetical protein
LVEDLADWGTSNEEGRRLYALAVTKKNVTSNAARIACLWCVGHTGSVKKSLNDWVKMSSERGHLSS